MAAAGWSAFVASVPAASRKIHAELDASTSLDDGNPEELGQSYQQLRKQLTRYR